MTLPETVKSFLFFINIRMLQYNLMTVGPEYFNFSMIWIKYMCGLNFSPKHNYILKCFTNPEIVEGNAWNYHVLHMFCNSSQLYLWWARQQPSFLFPCDPETRPTHECSFRGLIQDEVHFNMHQSKLMAYYKNKLLYGPFWTKLRPSRKYWYWIAEKMPL